MSSIDWGFLEAFFGAHGKLIATAIALVVAVISLVIWVFRYLSERIREREREKLEFQIRKQKEFYDSGTAALALAQQELERQRNEIKVQQAEIQVREQALNDVRVAFTGKEHELWCLHDARKPVDYDSRMRLLRRTPVIMVANLKGGVGKTTLTANLAAYFSAKGKRVLIVKVDYQGSLSNMMLLADDCQQVLPGRENAARSQHAVIHPHIGNASLCQRPERIGNRSGSVRPRLDRKSSNDRVPSLRGRGRRTLSTGEFAAGRNG